MRSLPFSEHGTMHTLPFTKQGNMHVRAGTAADLRALIASSHFQSDSVSNIQAVQGDCKVCSLVHLAVIDSCDHITCTDRQHPNTHQHAQAMLEPLVQAHIKIHIWESA